MWGVEEGLRPSSKNPSPFPFLRGRGTQGDRVMYNKIENYRIKNAS